MGRFDEARIELKKAQELDPLSLLTNTSLGRLLYFTRQYDEAALQLTKTLDMDPKFVPAQHAIEAAYAQNGMFKEAVGERQKVLTLSGSPDLAASIGEDFNASGYPGSTEEFAGRFKGSIQTRLRFVLQHGPDLRPAGRQEPGAGGTRTGLPRPRQQPHVCEGRTRFRRRPFRSPDSRK